MSVSRGSSGLPRALRIILDEANSLRMSAGAVLLRTGSQSVLVQRTEPVLDQWTAAINNYIVIRGPLERLDNKRKVACITRCHEDIHIHASSILRLPL